MDQANLPQPEFETLTNALLEILGRGAGEHRSARFHVDVEGAEKPELPSLTREGRLVSTDPQSKGKPFVRGNVSKPTIALLQAATKQGRPLYMVQFDFAKDGAAWKYALKAQSLDEYRAMCAARTPLEEQTTPLLTAAVEPSMPDWREINWNVRLPPMCEEQVNLFASIKDLDLQKMPISAALTEQLKVFQDFHRAQGFELQIMEFKLVGGAKKRIRDVRVLYV